MAILKVGHEGKSIAAAIRYAAKDADKENQPELASGINCSDNSLKAIEDMRQTKDLWNKVGGRQYKSYIQSFANGEVTAEQANQLGKEWAEKAFGNGYEVFIGTHINSESGIVHNHIIVNTVNYLDGHKLQLPKGMLERLKNTNDEVCREHGLSVIDRSRAAIERRNRVQAWSNEKYKNIRDKNSWMQEAVNDLKHVLNKKPKTAKKFVQEMNRLGWNVNFRGQKHITLQNKANPKIKVRVDTLAKTFNNSALTKAAIVKGFKQDKLTVVTNSSASNFAGSNRNQSEKAEGKLKARLAQGIDELEWASLSEEEKALESMKRSI